METNAEARENGSEDISSSARREREANQQKRTIRKSNKTKKGAEKREKFVTIWTRSGRNGVEEEMKIKLSKIGMEKDQSSQVVFFIVFVRGSHMHNTRYYNKTSQRMGQEEVVNKWRKGTKREACTVRTSARDRDTRRSDGTKRIKLFRGKNNTIIFIRCAIMY